MMTPTYNKPRTLHRVAERLASLCALAAALALGACGGGSGDSSVPKTGQGAQGAESANASSIFGEQSLNAAPGSQTIALQEEGARLNTAELRQIAKTGELPDSYQGPLLSGAAGSTEATLNTATGAIAEAKSLAEAKSAASRTAVYRFFNSRTSAHFFTTSTTERDNVRATLPHMGYEGPAFYASGTAVPGLSPVHRFYNTQTGVHFYTISEDERAHVAATLPQFSYEGIAYYASTLPGTGYTPLYRFFYGARGFHFYTNSAAEKDNIIATLPQYSYEGVGYYVLGSDWQTPVIPHTGITSSHCYRAGSNTLESCGRAGASALNSNQDGHRSTINSLSYSLVVSGYFNAPPIAFPLYYPKTSCVLDNVTGLIWEGKEGSGTRGGDERFTHFADSRASDASAYVNTVNASNLCGFDDWRLPEAKELQGLLNLGVGNPQIDSTFFPNTVATDYWTSTADVDDPAKGWRVTFGSGVVYPYDRNRTARVRLVRGSAWAGPRYLITTAAFPSDSANNAVVDRKSGLTWRRCLQGMTWNGSACSGAINSAFDHEAALSHANSQSNWRLPNVKELGSLVQHGRVGEKLDPNFFPGGQGVPLWTSTPYFNTTFVNDSFDVNFLSGRSDVSDRSETKGIRLVFIEP